MNVCTICSEKFTEFPCSARPINDGQCCPRCDDLIVTTIRMLASCVPVHEHIVIVEMFQRAIAMRAAKAQATAQLLKQKGKKKR